MENEYLNYKNLIRMIREDIYYIVQKWDGENWSNKDEMKFTCLIQADKYYLQIKNYIDSNYS